MGTKMTSTNMISTNMSGSKWLVVAGACFAAVGVGLGAIGAHSLPNYLTSQQILHGTETNKAQEETDKKLNNFEKGVRYQLYHAMAILGIGFSPLSSQSRGLRIGAYWMALGIVLFSGGIYGIVFTTYPTHWIVPFGGLSFILGWIWLAVSVAFDSTTEKVKW